MEAVQITLVLPHSIRQEPSAWGRKFGVILMLRRLSAARPVRVYSLMMVLWGNKKQVALNYRGIWRQRPSENWQSGVL